MDSGGGDTESRTPAGAATATSTGATAAVGTWPAAGASTGRLSDESRRRVPRLRKVGNRHDGLRRHRRDGGGDVGRRRRPAGLRRVDRGARLRNGEGRDRRKPRRRDRRQIRDRGGGEGDGLDAVQGGRVRRGRCEELVRAHRRRGRLDEGRVEDDLHLDRRRRRRQRAGPIEEGGDEGEVHRDGDDPGRRREARSRCRDRLGRPLRCEVEVVLGHGASLGPRPKIPKGLVPDGFHTMMRQAVSGLSSEPKMP